MFNLQLQYITIKYKLYYMDYKHINVIKKYNSNIYIYSSCSMIFIIYTRVWIIHFDFKNFSTTGWCSKKTLSVLTPNHTP